MTDYIATTLHVLGEKIEDLKFSNMLLRDENERLKAQLKEKEEEKKED